MSEKPESPQVTDCSCCGYEDVECEFYPKRTGGGATAVNREDRWLCRLCSHTLTSSLNYSPEKTIMETLCWIGNDLKQLIEERT